MKFIARQNLRNAPILRLKDDAGKSTVDCAKHDDHIHKGAIFDLGPDAKDLAELVKKDREAGKTAAMLISTGGAAPADDAKAVQAVKDELEIERKREAAAAALNTQAQLAGLGADTLAALKKTSR